MRRLSIAVISILLIVCLVVPAFATIDVTGNGAPSGRHYTLNIIGVAKDKTADMTGSNGHVIFVPLSGKSKIELMEAPEGESYKVLDGNATDGPAVFQLPKPGIDPYLIGGDMEGVDTMTDYSVFVRSLGKPGGWATITTCAELADSTFAKLLSGKFLNVLNRKGYFGGYASVEQVGQDITFRTKGKSIFTNVTAELLTIVFKVEVELFNGPVITEYVRVPIFDDIISGEYWEYDNNGLKLLQVRFYPVGTDVTYADDSY